MSIGMQLIVFLVALIALCAIGIYTYIFVINNQVKKLAPEIVEATQDFNRLSDLHRRFTVEEKDNYLNTNKPLYEKSGAYSQKKFVTNTTLAQTGIREFIKLYKCTDSVCQKNNEIRDRVETVDEKLNKYEEELSKFLDSDHYFSYSECQDFLEDIRDFKPAIEELKMEGHLKLLADEAKATDFCKKIADIESTRKQHNTDFVNKELREKKTFFDSVLAHPLDPQQRESIVKLEDNCQVVASAGSGKTTTMMGKIKYLIEQRHVDPASILTITYTRKAAEELSGRLNNSRLRCLTFHKLAMDIIGQVNGRHPAIADANLFTTIFYDKLREQTFKQAVVDFLIEYQHGAGNMLDYTSAEAYVADRKKFGNQALFPDMNGRMVFTKSEEEKRIVSYLTKMGVKFLYEEKYKFDEYDAQHRQYKPDFTIYYDKLSEDGAYMVRHLVYLEHYGVDENNNVPLWFGNGTQIGYDRANNQYRQGMEWKADVHRQHRTTLIYTRSADFKNGNAEAVLERKLRAVGVPIKRLSTEELYQMVVGRNEALEKSIMNMCQGFLMLMKANQHDIDWAVERAREKQSDRDVFLIDKLMRPLYEAYQKALADREEQDFTDVILEATQICENGLWRGYTNILVDEFQDISTDRYRFLSALRKTKSSDNQYKIAKLYCVGDDWQSIYRFSGSDMSLFNQFADYFGYTEICRIETTYRFGHPLIGVSSNFIMQNPIQMRKDVRPMMVANPAYAEWQKQTHPAEEQAPEPMVPLTQTNIGFVEYGAQSPYDIISETISYLPANASVYILGRYTYDVKALEDKENDNRVRVNRQTGLITVMFGDKEVRFLTVHSSKGLEADYCFLLNCNSGIYGFPSQVADDPVMEYVLSQADTYDFAEERRVFYVGITRAKKKTYILYDSRKPSEFVNELHDTAPLDADSCPICRAGHQMVLRTGQARNGAIYRVKGCSNNRYGCPYFEREFER